MKKKNDDLQFQEFSSWGRKIVTLGTMFDTKYQAMQRIWAHVIHMMHCQWRGEKDGFSFGNGNMTNMTDSTTARTEVGTKGRQLHKN